MNDFFNIRAQILAALDKQDCSLQELNTKINIPDSEISPHIESLIKLGILSKRKVGESMKYALEEESREKVNLLIQEFSSLRSKT
ncbi:MAG: ArsR family transcriptional regulator [Promethearchaeota archaeon]